MLLDMQIRPETRWETYCRIVIGDVMTRLNTAFALPVSNYARAHCKHSNEGVHVMKMAPYSKQRYAFAGLIAYYLISKCDRSTLSFFPHVKLSVWQNWKLWIEETPVLSFILAEGLLHLRLRSFSLTSEQQCGGRMVVVKLLKEGCLHSWHSLTPRLKERISSGEGINKERSMSNACDGRPKLQHRVKATPQWRLSLSCQEALKMPPAYFCPPYFVLRMPTQRWVNCCSLSWLCATSHGSIKDAKLYLFRLLCWQ